MTVCDVSVSQSAARGPSVPGKDDELTADTTDAAFCIEPLQKIVLTCPCSFQLELPFDVTDRWCKPRGRVPQHGDGSGQNKPNTITSSLRAAAEPETQKLITW